ncbi:hypothetical protein GIB67_030012 [Kingdonia uniflora]|uniref:K+ potassium transporter integral membrane domain-containing protein n=1 Tax=Kingdonia uniflora TaxID=39325 RepID=A0A7J7MY79_9MAGN|nr:hypothetical protein GIB67_030012 [Kingdonia uniflora]
MGDHEEKSDVEEQTTPNPLGASRSSMKSFSEIYRLLSRKPEEGIPFLVLFNSLELLILQDYAFVQTMALAYSSLGMVYGDIGTSPLYTFSSVRLANPGEEDIIGFLSLVIWTLTLIGLVKYVSDVLLADDHGEGKFIFVFLYSKYM